MSRVYMIRHGKPASTWGGDDLDPGLDEAGRVQAEQVAEVLLALPARPLRVVSSPLRRCRETAEPFARALGVAIEIDPAVGEIPTPASVPHDERPEWLRRAFAGRWSEIEGDIDYGQWRTEVASALARHAGAAVFSHYVAINGAVSLATADDRVMAFRPDHCSITTFEVDTDGLILIEKGREAATQVL
ncbi:MAG TPA: histidine phosphatase family protein [Caulobacteraceae bacterium]